MLSIILSLFLSGIVLGAGPCIGSCGPLLVSYTAGTKLGLRQSLRVYIIFSLGRIFAYVLLGAAVGVFAQIFIYGDFLGEFIKYIYIAAGIFVFFIGLLILLWKEPKFKACHFFVNQFIKKDTKSLFILGLFIGISPCVPLLGILISIIPLSYSWIKAVIFMLSFGLGTIISPLLLMVVFAGYIPKVFKNNEKFYNAFQKICGLILCLLGLQLIYLAIKF